MMKMTKTKTRTFRVPTLKDHTQMEKTYGKLSRIRPGSFRKTLHSNQSIIQAAFEDHVRGPIPTFRNYVLLTEVICSCPKLRHRKFSELWYNIHFLGTGVFCRKKKNTSILKCNVLSCPNIAH
jgi:hypothetical protein